MKVRCPTCGRETEYSPQNPYRPFCSERCRLIDLGAWANDEYRIEGEPGSAGTMTPEDFASAAEQRALLDAKNVLRTSKGKKR